LWYKIHSLSPGGYRLTGHTLDELARSRNSIRLVIPANPGLKMSGAGTGIRLFQDVLDPGFRRGDDQGTFF